MNKLLLAVASLNQTPLDWDGNYERICDAIAQAQANDVAVLCLPELCISGYGCEDAFLSASTQRLAKEYLLKIAAKVTKTIVALGLPIEIDGHLYNGCALVSQGEIHGIALKRALPKEGIHYEPRWFRPWKKGAVAGVMLAGSEIPVGDLVFDCAGVKLGIEICEDAWVADRPGLLFSRAGVDVICNPSASHFAFAKNTLREQIVAESSRAFTCAYLYANALGNEAGRIVYDGNSLLGVGGKIVARGRRFSFQDVSIASAIVDLGLLRAKRQAAAETEESEEAGPQIVSVPATLPEGTAAIQSQLPAWENDTNTKEQEFARAVSLGLFDYMRKSRSRGYVVSLSGGADSSATACLVALAFVFASEELGVAGVCRTLDFIPELQGVETWQGFVQRLLTCVYQSTKNSSDVTEDAARSVAKELGCEFHAVSIDSIVGSYSGLLETALGLTLSWEEHDIALQNIQARVRGPLVWMIANVKRALLLTTSNRSEAAVGYTTMDGDTCGGLSPIGGIDKAFLLSWIRWLRNGGVAELGELASLEKILVQEPTAELRPKGASQTDEQDLMPYEILDYVEYLAIGERRAPAEVFESLRAEYPEIDSETLLSWIERFYTLWSRNQWKRERYAPSFHLDDVNLDPKTWCRFPILSGGFSRELADLRAKQVPGSKG